MRGAYYGWTIVLATILAQIPTSGLTFLCFSLFLHDWSTEMQVPISVLQLSTFGLTITGAATSPLTGVLVDKYPARWIFAAGLYGMAAFYLAMSYATSAWHIMLLYATLGPVALNLATSTPSNALISRWFVRRLGTALGVSALGLGLAGLLVPTIVAAALPGYGWRTVWRIAGLLLALVVAPIILLLIREAPTAREGLHYVRQDKPHAVHPNDEATAPSLRAVMRRSNFWFVLAAFVPMMGVYGGVAENLAPYAASHGLSHRFAASMISLLSISQLVSILGSGFVADRFGNRLPFAFLALCVSAGTGLLAVADAVPMIAAGILLIGLCGGMYTLLASALAREFGARAFGRAYGTAMLFIPFASLSSFAIARIKEHTGSYSPALIGLSIAVLIGGALVLMLRERAR